MKGIDIISKLVAEIEYLNEEYRNGNPIISDSDYDGKLERLRELDPKNPIFEKGILEHVPVINKRKLQFKMMSLDKEKSVEDIIKWLRGVGMGDNDEVVLTPKYNGISLLFNAYKYQITTRGDGVVGQNCDRHINSIHIGMNVNLGYFAGEAIISKYHWGEHFANKMNENGVPYKLNNATVSGMLNADESSKMLRYVDFMPYTILDDTRSKSQQLHDICTSSTVRPAYMVVEVKDLCYDLVNSFYHSNTLEYPIDGVVIDINDNDKRKQLGVETNGNPAYARALKLTEWVSEFNTTINGYLFTVSKQGKIKGVVTFDPVNIDGTEVKQATFYNARFLYDFCLYPGVEITVKKSGEIIPKIVAVEGNRIPLREEYKKEADYLSRYEEVSESIENALYDKKINRLSIDFCSSCGSVLVWDTNKVERQCLNLLCEGRQISKIEHFFLTMEVEEFGRPTIEAFFKAGYNTIESILRMSMEDIISIEGFAEQSATILRSQFDRILIKGASFAKLMYAYDVFDGIIGEKTVQLILDNISFDNFDFNGVQLKDLVKIKGVAEKTGVVFLEGLNKFFSIPELIPITYISSNIVKPISDKCKDVAVCFSGIRDKELEDVIIINGGKVVGDVSKKTTHLIVLDVDQNTGKTVKARSLGINILTIQDFKQTFGL